MFVSASTHHSGGLALVMRSPLLYYDINALSNFVADAANVVGFDPFVKLVDFLEERAER